MDVRSPFSPMHLNTAAAVTGGQAPSASGELPCTLERTDFSSGSVPQFLSILANSLDLNCLWAFSCAS